MKSNAKRALAAGAALAVVAAAGLCLYALPRRLVPSLPAAVPSDGLAACVRVRGLGPVWRRCVSSEFARRVLACGIFPLDEMAASDPKFRRRMENLDLSLAPHLLGEDCVLAIYAAGGDRAALPAAWGRIGFRVRLAHAAARARDALSFRRRSRRSRAGGLAVTAVLDRKTGEPRYSYALVGDLGIAAAGFDEAFWLATARAVAGGGETAAALLPPVAGAGAEGAAGSLHVRVGEVLRGGDLLLERLAAGDPERFEAAAGIWRRARRAAAAAGTVDGTFTLAGHAGAELRVRPAEGARLPEGPPRDPGRDPLAGLMASGGVLYAGGAADLRAAVAGLRERGGAARVEFIGGSETAAYGADHFVLPWLGDDLSLVVYRDARGMVGAALSAAVRDRRLAAARIAKFMALADRARVVVRDAGGDRLAGTREPLRIRTSGAGADASYRVGFGWPFDQIYTVTVGLRGDRLIAATDGSPFAGERRGPPPGAAWAAPASGQAILRGSDAAGAAAALGGILTFVIPFMEEGRDRDALLGARRFLAALEWLEPLREGWAAVDAAGGEGRVRCGAALTDPPPRARTAPARTAAGPGRTPPAGG
ncbi:MAG: hypothetical protein PHN82_00775 [bacterium]|nr:hypothetical protein [bacterium]